MSDDGDWFAPKRYGYGTGNPITWQGWAVLGVYIAVLTIAGFALLPRHWGTWAAIIALATITLTVICVQHTRGGWRWRWGEND
ncbi:MAG: hypothetical protein E7773_10625 [Sphingomonas sp.]|uniref:hypothetical protein n=1 Tax=Sphingomonas sp. TaxID=28214 RepID=UPI0011FD2DA7|nr:hypothetical protein [Sphingomonas sp.]THD35561.1 MAG: hypothetical protein E7773_10625 [Sphingomonas sp.]